MLWRVLETAFLFGGAGAIVVGVAQWSPPAAWVVAGLAMIALVLTPGRR